MTVAVFIFAKPPRVGVSKTRLAVGVGQARAAALARAFLADTIEMLRRLPVEVVLATTEPTADFGLKDAPPRIDQGQGELGARLERVLRDGLKQAEVVVAMGADSPGLSDAHVEGMLEQLSTHDAVFIPATDGGFVALALRVVPPHLFDSVPWSRPNTLVALRSRMERLGLRVASVDAWFDIDVLADLEHFREHVSVSAAPNTWSVLGDVA